MFTEDVLLALVKVGGLVVVCVVIIRTFGPTINLLIRKKFNLSQEGKAVQEDTVAAAMERADRATFQFRCPGGHVLEGTTDMAGQPGECPVCGAAFVIPESPMRLTPKRPPTTRPQASRS